MADYNTLLLRKKLTKALTFGPVASSDRQLKALEEIFVSCRGYKPQDPQEVFSDVVRLSCGKDLRMKKLVYLYLTLAINCNPDIILHVTNSASNDLADPNPLVRSSVLRSITEFALIPDVTSDFILSAITVGLQDQSPTVRCIAVDGVTCINRSSKGLKESANYLAGLLEKVAQTAQTDPDPSVVVKCVQCLASCGVKDQLVQECVLSLLDRILLLESWLAIILLDCANKYLNCKKLNEGEVIAVLNKLEPFRCLSTNHILAVGALSLMYKVSCNFEDIMRDVSDHVVSDFISLLSISNRDVRYLILCNLHTLGSLNRFSVRNRLIENLRCFVLLSGDPAHVLFKKLEILAFCVTEEMALQIYNNIRVYLHKCNMNKVTEAAFNVLVILHTYLPEKCDNALFCLLHSTSAVVADAAVHAIYSIKLKQNQIHTLSDQLITALCACHCNLKSFRSKSCCLWLISRTDNECNTKAISKALKLEVSTFKDTDNTIHQECILSTAMQLYVKWPGTFCSHLKQLLPMILGSNQENFVKEHAKLYYVLLKTDISLLKSLVSPCIIPSFGAKYQAHFEKSDNVYSLNSINFVSETCDS